MRFSLSTFIVIVAVLAVSLRLNMRQRRAVDLPDMTGLSDVKHLVVTVHYEVGWPIWFARHTDSFAAHNAPAYLDQDRRYQEPISKNELDDFSILDQRHIGPLTYVPNVYRLAFNIGFVMGLSTISVYLLRSLSGLCASEPNKNGDTSEKVDGKLF